MTPRTPPRSVWVTQAQQVGRWLREAREAAGLTVEEVAAAARLPTRTLVGTEDGAKRTRASVLLAFACAIDPIEAGSLFNQLLAAGGNAIAPENPAPSPGAAVKRRARSAMQVLRDPDATEAAVAEAKAAIFPPRPGHEDMARQAADTLRATLVAEELAKRARRTARSEQLAKRSERRTTKVPGQRAVRSVGVRNSAHDFGQVQTRSDSEEPSR